MDRSDWRIRMKYVLLFADTIDMQELLHQSPGVAEKVMKWFEENGRKGVVVSGEELQGPGTATTVRLKDGKVTVTDGPFIEAKEVIGGFAIAEVKDLDEALALAKSWPGGGVVEVRPIVDHSAH
jgi:hypothetical protein